MHGIELEKNIKLQDFLRDLSIECYSESVLFAKSLILLEIYTDDFRHGYVYIFSVMVEIVETRDAKQVMETLQTNLSCLKNQMPERKEFSGNIYKCFNKLYDHTMLEMSRLQHWGNIIKKQINLEEDLEKANDELSKANELLKKTHDEVKNSKLEAVGILGVFSAIICAFMGGLSYISSALVSIQKVSIYKAGFITIICGFVIFNTVVFLLYMVAKILGKNIYSNCSDKYSTGDCVFEYCDKRCNSLKRLLQRLPYVMHVNGAFVALLILIVFLWGFNFDSMKGKFPEVLGNASSVVYDKIHSATNTEKLKKVYQEKIQE